MGSRKFLIGLVGVAALLFAGAANAAAPTGPEAVPAPFAAKLTTLDAAFQRVEAGASQMTTKRVLTRADLDANAGLDDAYTKALMGAFDTAVKDAQQAASSKGASGNVAELKAFEDLAVRHEVRLKAIAVQADQFSAKIRSGAVKIDPAVVKSWSAPERQEFMKSLEPTARSAYPIALLEGVDPLAPASLLSQMDDSKAQQAYAAIVTGANCSAVAPCVSPCFNKQWVACANCLYSKSPGVYTYYTGTFLPRWNNGAGKPRWMPLWAWRAQAAAALVQVVA